MFGDLNNQQVHHDSTKQRVNDEERLYCHGEHGEVEDPDCQNPHDVCVITHKFICILVLSIIICYVMPSRFQVIPSFVNLRNFCQKEALLVRIMHELICSYG